MAKPPPVHELRFLRVTANHAEFRSRLTELAIGASDVKEFAEHVFGCWLHLADEHLLDAKSALTANRDRAVYSRAYYAAYNASKAVRYLSHGFVSLKGDDHANASSDLPDKFPNVAQWSQDITTLYEHRLRADYDNWTDTAANHTLAPSDAVTLAENFIAEARSFIAATFGVSL